MNHFSELYEYRTGVQSVPMGLNLVAGLSGFTDSGHVFAQFAQHIFSSLKHELVLQFANDELLDYRSRRPVMYFERDHIASYEPAILGIYLVHDESNEPFLFLHGYEPDFKWEAFSDAILEIVEELQVADFTWVHSIPFPTPHSRPVGITVSGNRSDVIELVSEWKPQTQGPGNIRHLIEYKLTQIELPVAGFVMLIPHYLSDTEFPQGTITALEQVSAATGLVFPTDSLRAEAVEVSKKIDEQLSKNEDLAKMVASLEAGYSSEINLGIRNQIVRPTPHMPSAEEIADELEGYLANRHKNGAEDEV